MKIIPLTNEYPPFISGGAGVHVEYIADGLSGINNGENKINRLNLISLPDGNYMNYFALYIYEYSYYQLRALVNITTIMLKYDHFIFLGYFNFQEGRNA